MNVNIKSGLVLPALLAFLLALAGCPSPAVPPPGVGGSVTITGGVTPVDSDTLMTTPFKATAANFAGATLTYTWSTLSGTTVKTLAGEVTNQDTYTPAPRTEGSYTVKVVVSDGTATAEATSAYVVNAVAAGAASAANAVNVTTIGVYTDTVVHKTVDFAPNAFLVTRPTDLAPTKVAQSTVESLTAPSTDGGSYLEASLKAADTAGENGGIFYFGNGRPESPRITGLASWNIKFKAKVSEGTAVLKLLWGNGKWTTEGTDFASSSVNLTTAWQDFTVGGGNVADVGLLIFSNGETVAKTIALDDVYLVYNAPSVTISGGSESLAQNTAFSTPFAATATKFSGTPTYAWTVKNSSGANVTQSGTTNASTFTPTTITTAGTYTVGVTVTDGVDTATGSSTVVVTEVLPFVSANPTGGGMSVSRSGNSAVLSGGGFGLHGFGMKYGDALQLDATHSISFILTYTDPTASNNDLEIFVTNTPANAANEPDFSFNGLALTRSPSSRGLFINMGQYGIDSQFIGADGIDYTHGNHWLGTTNGGDTTLYHQEVKFTVSYNSGTSKWDIVRESANTTFGGGAISTSSFAIADVAADAFSSGAYLVINSGLNKTISANGVVIKAVNSKEPHGAATYASPVAGMTISSSTLSLTAGSWTSTLTAAVTPTFAANQAVSWSSSNESVATVSSSGIVSPITEGVATITATSVADNTKTAQCTVTVAAPRAVGFSEGFESPTLWPATGSSVAFGGWLLNNIAVSTDGDNDSVDLGTMMMQFNSATDIATLPVLAGPCNLNFKLGTNATPSSWTLLVQKSTDSGTSWTTIGTYSSADGDMPSYTTVTNAPVSKTLALSESQVLIRFNMTERASTGGGNAQLHEVSTTAP